MLKIKRNLVAFFISFIAILEFRTYEIIKMNVLQSSQFNLIETICLGCTVIFSLLIILMSYLSKNIPKKFKLSKNIFLGVISVIVAILLIVNSAVNIFTLFTASEVEIVLLFTGAFSVLTGVIFFVLCRVFLKAENIFEDYQLIILIPTIWLAVRLYQFFLQFRNVSMNVQYISGELSVIFLLLYFLHFAKLFSGMYAQKVYKKLCMYGLIGALFVVMSVTYNAFNIVLNNTFSLYDVVLSVTDLTLAIFMVSFVCFLNKNTEVIEEKLNATQENKANQPTQTQATDGNTVNVQKASGGKNKNFDMESINRLIDEISR